MQIRKGPEKLSGWPVNQAHCCRRCENHHRDATPSTRRAGPGFGRRRSGRAALAWLPWRTGIWAPVVTIKLLSLNIGRARAISINNRKVMSAIAKQAVDGPHAVHALGIDGDEQADQRLHGGIAKAVYAYPSEHYGFWQTVRAQAQVALWDESLPPGALGENLTLAGLIETQVWIGDVLRFPDCELAVSDVRTPCSKLNVAMGFKQAGQLMTSSAWCGFYLAVRVPGTINAGQTCELVAGPREVGIVELFRARVRG